MSTSSAVLSARERTIRSYFSMWIERDCSGIENLFSDNVVYIESDGKEYHGAEQLVRWFGDWFDHGKVERWDVSAFSHFQDKCFAEWNFVCVYDGSRSEFDGVTVAEFDADGRISTLREFAAAHERTLPYGD
ncbi:MAG: nuclear transport factor 2 family protein [Ruminococcaceae bacterium]|nr:nuclear transport factor 2 family protein [Oscillospiraceae bacterium]